MRLYSSLIGSFVLFEVFKCQTVTSVIDKSVLTLQQILKMASSSSLLTPTRNLEATFLNSVSMKDISNALQAVTNDTKQINQLIPKMFDVRSPNPSYVFNLPQGTKHKFFTMHRSSFENPIFPNLTTSYVRLMKNRGAIDEFFNGQNKNEFQPYNLLEDKVNSNNLVEEDKSTLVLNLQTERNFIEFLNKVNQLEDNVQNSKETNIDEWSALGLNGWQGTISKNNEEKHTTLNENELLNNKPTEIVTQEWDLPGKMSEKSLKYNLLRTMKNSKIMQIVENYTQQSTYPITTTHSSHSDTDVYIARVNDPFGHSTKWNQKNSSSNHLMDDRKKRGVIELYSMIKCSTGCDPIIFKGYGCYCGFLGDGLPVDGIDRCCRLHDKCYEYSNCIPYLEYFVPYIWKCYRGKPLCAIAHGEWGGPHSCASRLCQCDLNLSRCLRRFVCPHRRSICRTSKSRILQNLLINF